MRYYDKVGAAVSAIAVLAATPVHAQQDITFGRTLIGSCILTLNTDGVLGQADSGTELNSEIGTGVSAVLAVVAIGAVPELTFTAPDLDAPGGDSGSEAFIRYTSLSGANQAYTDAESSYQGGLLIDAYTINAKVENEDGFASGQYTVTTTATCEQ